MGLTNVTGTEQPPGRTQILVIGGGPAGAYAATVLAREAFSVVLLEAAKFPRYHIGESMLPSVRPFLRFIGAEDAINGHGFTRKPGAAVKFNQYKREGYTDFVALNPDNASWNVIRSEFDEMLLMHAKREGVSVFEECRVDDIAFHHDQPHRPTQVTYTQPSGTRGSISFDYLVDASGRAGLMSTRYLRNRKMNHSLRNNACWSYWEGAGKYGAGTTRENAPWFEALTDQSGWSWFIPLHDGTVSVGIVINSELAKAKREAQRAAESTLKDYYLAQLALAPGLRKLLKGATLRDKEDYPTIRYATDYSYAAASYAGDHFRLVGDASAFIDPLFSSGVHLAFASALTAAISIAASIRGHCSEAEAASFHDAKVGVSYTRFLLVVLGAYKQIREQDAPVFSAVDEDNFDRAFHMIRPVIQGTAEVGQKLTEDEVQRTMDFIKHVFTSPTDPEMYDAVGARLGKELLSPQGPIISEDQISRLIAVEDTDTRHVLREVNARKPIHAMYSGPEYFASEPVNGLRGHVQVGSLGLRKH